jgi:outer membrane protein assembly factor BamA
MHSPTSGRISTASPEPDHVGHFQVAETPRVYVERIDINGNTNTATR